MQFEEQLSEEEQVEEQVQEQVGISIRLVVMKLSKPKQYTSL